MSKNIALLWVDGAFRPQRGDCMSAADQYRRNACECIAITAFFSDPGQRATILALAEAWTRLAQQSEKYEQIAQLATTPPPSSEGA
jgi:hypothetical protein